MIRKKHLSAVIVGDTICVTIGGKGTGSYALIDCADWPLVSKYSWVLDSHGYAMAHNKGKRGAIYMHKIIGGPGLVDHINRLRLDNRRSNIRRGTNSLNSLNRCKRSGLHASKYVGVSLDLKNKKNPWRARLAHKGKTIFSACCRTEGDAALFIESARNNLIKTITNQK